jgi:hypothetical protein
MPIKKRSPDLSPRRCNGIMGPDTRQRAALIGHPLSLHHSSECSTGFNQFSAPPPSPKQTGGPHVCSPARLFIEWDGMRVRMCF